jgi:pyridoxal 5'-phosphate synthase pdxT subunit
MFLICLHLTALRNVAGNNTPVIGVLALQGDVAEHVRILVSLGALVKEIRQPDDCVGIEGLIIPGGESTVMDKLTRIFDLVEPLRALIAEGLPMLGTCAGLIMLSSDLEDASAGQKTLGGLDVTVARNAFGTQLDSFETEVTISGMVGDPLQVAFIRAPIVTRVGSGVSVIATLPDGRIVGVTNGQLMGVSFHPEIMGDDRLHRMFLDLVQTRNNQTARAPSA